MKHGGRRPGAGRKPGSVTQRTREIAEAIATEGGTPLEFLTQIYRDETQELDRRIDCAKAAAPYVHARLAAVQVNGPGEEGEHLHRVLNDDAAAFRRRLLQGIEPGGAEGGTQEPE